MSLDQAFGLGRIEQIALLVEDPDRATAFYRDRLGMRYLFSSNGLVFFDCGGVRLMLGRPEGASVARPGSVIYFAVPDIHEAHRALVGRGVVFEGPPHKIGDMGDYELWMAFFHDSEGNLLAISGQVRPAGATPA